MAPKVRVAIEAGSEPIIGPKRNPTQHTRELGITYSFTRQSTHDLTECKEVKDIVELL